MTPVRSLHWRLIASSVLVVTVSTLPAFITGAAIAQAGPDIGYGVKELGALTSLFFLTAAVSSSQIGDLIERVGWRTTMRFNSVSAAIILMIIATTVRNVWALGAVLVVSAAIYGGANPAANLALAEHIPHDRRGLVFGIKHAGIPGSTLLSGLAVPLVVLTLGWPWAYAAGAVVALGVFFLIPTHDDTKEAPGEIEDRPPMTQRWLTVLGLGSAFATLAAGVLGTFHVDAAITYGFSESAAGQLLAAASLTSIAARATYGYLADRIDVSGLSWVSVLAAIGALSFFALGPSGGFWFAAFTLAAFATGWGWPGLLTFGVVRANAGRPAGSTAITQAGVFVGAGVSPFVFSRLIDSFSYQAAWIVTGTGLLLASITVLVVRYRGVPAVSEA